MIIKWQLVGEQVALVAAGSQSDKSSFLCASVSGEASVHSLWADT